jgi:hypothetical protein
VSAGEEDSPASVVGARLELTSDGMYGILDIGHIILEMGQWAHRSPGVALC